MKRITALILVIFCLAATLVGCVNVEKSYEKLDGHVTANGVSEHGIHTLPLGTTAEPDGAVYTRHVERTPAEISLILTVTEGETALYTFRLILPKADLDVYRWEYASSAGDEMSGTIVAEEYLRAAYNLDYLTTNIKDSVAVVSAAGLSKSLCNYLLEKLEGDLSAIELNAEELGFEDFED